jgi:hypothetical protein
MSTQKLFCYVDETGQDARATSFLIVAVVSDQDQTILREQLTRVERAARTGQRKWHKSRPDRRLRYLEAVLAQQLGHREVFFGSYPKPIPYFFPLLDVLEHAIHHRARPPYRSRVYVDGIDRKKAAELTNALRSRGIALDLVRSRRDESEPVIRLADMWAGCIRAALSGNPAAQATLTAARNAQYLTEVTKQKAP